MSATMTPADGAEVAYAVEQVFAGVDWLSCSLPAAASNGWLWADECRRIIEEIAEEGHKLEARTLNGYRGLAAGASFFGARDDGLYLQISSHRADRYLSRVYRSDLHFSRLDVQVTVRFRGELPDYGRHLYGMATDANEALPIGRRRRIWYMSGNDGGYTLYIGSPSSDQRGRIYNKAAQSEDPLYTRCWRYEACFRNHYAQFWADRIAYADENAANLCAHIVWVWFEGRGVECSWRMFNERVTMPLFNEVPSDAEKKLKWLETQVRPALRWLVQQGYRIEAAAALGMEPMDDYPAEDGPALFWRFDNA